MKKYINTSGLTNSSILYIGPKFFDYELEIKKTLEELGASVDFYDDRPKNNFLTKALIRLNLKSFIRANIDRYYKTIYSDVKDKNYNYVFVISPETLDYRKLQKIKNLQDKATYVLYMWDSFKVKNSFNLIELFDKVLTFDSQDSEKYNIEFLPLFYIKGYENVRKPDVYKHDVCFMATAHSDRYKIVQNIKRQLDGWGLEIFSFLYLPSKVIYWIRKLFVPRYRYGSVGDFSFNSLSQKEIVGVVEQSKAVLDINHPLQHGLTMRSIETLGAKRKFITTNENIRNYEFYNENNILIVNRKNPIINRSFLNKEYTVLDAGIYEKYALRTWLTKVFDCEINYYE